MFLTNYTVLLEDEKCGILSCLALFNTSDMYVTRSHMTVCKLAQAQMPLEWNPMSTDDEKVTGVEAFMSYARARANRTLGYC